MIGALSRYVASGCDMAWKSRRQWLVLVVGGALIATLLLFSPWLVQLATGWLSPDEPGDLHNYSLIEDGLYLGGSVTEPPPGTRAVLNVGESEDSYRAEVHRWQPIRDAAPAPSIDWLRQQVEFVDQQRRAGLPAYVHCQAGISRGGMVVTAYLMARDGLTRDQALALIRTRRPMVRPNPAFMNLLLEWQEVVKKQSM
jgi:hypothetical protein